MNTETISVDPTNPDPVAIQRAAAEIRAGRLVAFPTETVYGLGANALDAAAVSHIFEAKGRPPTNPIIVHVAELAQVLNVAANWPETADRLARRFWPGPLTIVVPKRKELPDAVTAGGSTVGVRCPNHAVARALITEAGVPIAAPSANRSTGLSPTRAEHVLAALNGRIDLILDGGPCPGGIESTVVDATGKTVRLLRPGLITVPMLESVVSVSPPRQQGTEPARSPGQMAKHYSPRTPIRLVHGDSLADDYLEARQAGLRFACVTFYREETEDDDGHPGGAFVNLPSNPERAAAMLYDALFRLDQKDLHMILVELPADTPAWAAIRDRLMRAAT